jgi:hypothetical protein
VVKGAKAAAGKRYGTSSPKLGQASLTGACSAAAILCLRHHPAGHTSLVCFEKTPGQGKALTILAPKLARTVYERLQRTAAFAREKCLRSEGRGAGEPAASRGRDGLSLATVRCHEGRLASAHA